MLPLREIVVSQRIQMPPSILTASVVGCLALLGGYFLGQTSFILVLLAAGLAHLTTILRQPYRDYRWLILIHELIIAASMLGVYLYTARHVVVNSAGLDLLWQFVRLELSQAAGYLQFFKFFSLWLVVTTTAVLGLSYIFTLTVDSDLLATAFFSASSLTFAAYYAIVNPMKSMAVFRPENAEPFVVASSLVTLLYPSLLHLVALGVFLWSAGQTSVRPASRHTREAKSRVR